MAEEDLVLGGLPEPAPLPPARPSGGTPFPNPDAVQPRGMNPLGMIPPPPPEMMDVPMSPPSPGGEVPSQGILGALGAFLTKPPANTRPRFGESQSKVPSPPLGMAMPPAASLLGRSALQGGAAGLEALEAGKGPLDIAKEAGKGAAFNVGAEAVLGPLARFIGRQSSAKGAQAGYEAAQAAHAAKGAHDKAMTNVLNTLEKSGFEKAAAGHAEKAASQIAADLESQVPALAGMEKSGKGLYDAIYGTGKVKVSAAFDEALKDVVSKGKGQIVQVPAEVAERYGLAGSTGGLPPEIAQRLKLRPGETFPGMPQATELGKVGVDAAELAQKMTGLWKKDPGAYRAAANALDAAGVGDPAARAAYKAYAGYSDFIDKAKGLDANGVLNTSNILKALADLKKVDVLRRRGLGSGTEGAVQAVRGGPLAPTPRQIPVQPPEPTPPDIQTVKNPLAGHGWIGGMAGGAVGHGLGMGPLGSGLGFLLGAGASNAMPKEIVTKGPLSAGAAKAAQNVPDIAGILARLGYNKVTST